MSFFGIFPDNMSQQSHCDQLECDTIKGTIPKGLSLHLDCTHINDFAPPLNCQFCLTCVESIKRMFSGLLRFISQFKIFVRCNKLDYFDDVS